MSDWTWYIGLCVAALAGVALSIFQLPGAWLTIAAAAVYDWHYDWQRVGWKWLVALVVLATIGEIIEFAASAVMVKRTGASRKAQVGALVGGFVGMILFTGLVPIPVIGTIAGGMIGCFGGALIGELSIHNELGKGLNAGLGATVGRLMGLVVKASISLVIAGAALVCAWN